MLTGVSGFEGKKVFATYFSLILSLCPFGAFACCLVLTYVVFLFIFIFLCFCSVAFERGLVLLRGKWL